MSSAEARKGGVMQRVLVKSEAPACNKVVKVSGRVMQSCRIQGGLGAVHELLVCRGGAELISEGKNIVACGEGWMDTVMETTASTDTSLTDFCLFIRFATKKYLSVVKRIKQSVYHQNMFIYRVHMIYGLYGIHTLHE